MKKRLILLSATAALFLLGAGCVNNNQQIIDAQQKQINDLTQSLKDSASSTAILQKQIDEVNFKKTTTPQPTASNEDPQIKIEICRAQAKNYADNLAKQMYLQAYQKAMNAGETQAATMYLNYSFKPEHPADYDDNYQKKYITCLEN